MPPLPSTTVLIDLFFSFTIKIYFRSSANEGHKLDFCYADLVFFFLFAKIPYSKIISDAQFIQQTFFYTEWKALEKQFIVSSFLSYLIPSFLSKISLSFLIPLDTPTLHPQKRIHSHAHIFMCSLIWVFLSWIFKSGYVNKRQHCSHVIY